MDRKAWRTKREKQHLPEGLENPLRNRHKGQAAVEEEEAAPKRTPKAGRVLRRDYPGRGGRPRLIENLESGAQEEPTGKGTEKTRVEERQHRRDRRQDTMEQPRGRREAERRARMEGSGRSTPKPQGTVKTRRTGTRRQAEERARKTTQRPGQSRKNGLGGHHGKTGAGPHREGGIERLLDANLQGTGGTQTGA